MTDPQRGNESADLPPDDRIIGRAFWASVAVVGVVTVGVVAWRQWPRAVAAAPPVVPLPVGPAVLAPVLGSAAAAALAFQDRSGASGDGWGIDFQRVTGAAGERLLPETMGGGVAVWDVDGDGDLDVIVPDGDAWPGAAAGSQQGQGIAVFLNQLEPASARSGFVRALNTGLEQPWQGMGIALADLDGDGRPEILATGVGGVRFFVAEHSAPGTATRWRDVTTEAGVAALGGWTTAAGFADFDQDGDLDLVLGRYVEWSKELDLSVNYTLTGLGRAYGAPTGFAGTDLVFMEQVSPMHFADRTAEHGLGVRNRSTNQPMAKALGFVIDDCDGDGDLDLFVANDSVQNFLFINDGRGLFDERGVAAGVAFDRNGAATGAMGCDAAHLRNNAALGIAVGNFANEPCSLYVTAGDGRFADDAIVDGISAATRRALTFGVAFVDLDSDGWEDLVLANGHIEDRIADVQPTQHYAQAAQVFWNRAGQSGATFTEVPSASLGALATPVVGRGLAWGDLDNDGALDIVIGAVSGAPLVVRNATKQGGHIECVLVDSLHAGNRDAIGAQVTLRLNNGLTLRRTVMPTRSYLSQVPPRACFGIGEVHITECEVRWPDGQRTHPSIRIGDEGSRVTISR
ncbi:MAG: CRTAC1 family protein [Planctomycetota bacterium]|nr:MAG: CRTAC1 family protein [Planctomycetota bacterium]